MDGLRLALSFELDCDNRIVEINHFNCTVSPAFHYLDRVETDVLVGAENADVAGYSGATKIEGTTRCRYIMVAVPCSQFEDPFELSSKVAESCDGSLSYDLDLRWACQSRLTLRIVARHQRRRHAGGRGRW